MKNQLMLLFFRFAAGGRIPASWFEPCLPRYEDRQARTGRLSLEIVSHCWKYDHFLIFQLSSLVLFPPQDIDVRMTVFYSREDDNTSSLLDFYKSIKVPGVEWNWQELPRQKLFRRSIGRNIAALNTAADWVWFTDCDLLFREKCLDTLAELLQGQRDALFFPDEERCTELLTSNSSIMQAGEETQKVRDIDTSYFVRMFPGKATGPLQIAHGDVCRAVGYCRHIDVYQQPSAVWCKAHEDRAFRWLLRSDGIGLPVPGVYRIRHLEKGRYTGTDTGNLIRKKLRIFQSWLRKNRLTI